jgi:tyrosinase
MDDLLSVVSRRDFLKGAGAFSAASLALWSGGCESCLRQIANRPTRRNIAELSPSDPIIQTFKQAVSTMKDWDTSHPTSPLNWTNQANIHYNHCPHGNWFFLPWHRAYLLYFERICRKLTGNNDFALPYWNWTTSPSIPAVFWDTTSSLYDPNRGVTQADTADPSWVGASVISNILSQPNFNVFASGPVMCGDQHLDCNYGMLEATPHNNIHAWIDSSDMGTFQSPRDPVFWTHHNMLDCLWVDWNINLNNANTNDTTWTNQVFSDFFDENGNPVTVQVIDTVLYPIFLYQFEPCAPGETPGQKMTRRQLERFLRTGAPSTLQFVQRFPLRQSLTAEVGKAATGAIRVEPEAFRTALEGGRNRVLLTLGEAEVPEKRDFFVRVFLNKPDVAAETPIEDPHYAGSFGFFFDESAMKKHEPAAGRPKVGFVVDVTATLRKLSQGGSLPAAEMDVSLVPVPYSHREAAGEKLTLGHLEVGITRY